MKKRIVSLLLALCVLCSTGISAFAAGNNTTGFSNFQKTNTYRSGQFTDIPVSTWYTENVIYAYELGLMKGSSTTTFNPEGNITVAETIALACRLNSLYFAKGADFQQGIPWYQVYVDYAISNGLIYNGQFSNYSKTATRLEFAAILAAALPTGALEPINNVTVIPDLAWGTTYADAVYKLYNAGVLTGSDEKGTFSPQNAIMRSEVATIVTRMAVPNMRKIFTLGTSQGNNDDGLSVSHTALTINTETVISVYVAETIGTIIWEKDCEVVDLRWGTRNNGVATLTIFPMEIGMATIRIYSQDNPSIYETITVTTTGTVDKLSVNTNSVKLSSTSKVYVTTPGDASVTWDFDSDIIRLKWGDWNGSTIPLIITPIKNGSTIIRVYLKDIPSEYELISVQVVGLAGDKESNTGTSTGNNTDDNNDVENNDDTQDESPDSSEKSYEEKMAEYLAYKKIVDAAIQEIKSEGDVYYGSEEYYQGKVSELTREISKIQWSLDSMAFDTSMSATAQKKQLAAEKAKLQAELDELQASYSRKASIAALESELQYFYNDLFGE